MSPIMRSDYLRVLVCGGRDYNDAATVYDVLSSIHISEVAHGGALGADKLADDWARQHWQTVSRRVYPADWNGPCDSSCRSGHRRYRDLGRPPQPGDQTYCPNAGPRRNQIMLDNFRPDLVIAFPGGRGTADMVRRAVAAGVEVRQVPADQNRNQT